MNEDRFETLRERTKRYASQVVTLYVAMQRAHRFDDAAMVLGKQLLRSGTSVAANHREAKHARSRAERIAKFHIVLQELEESALWLELLTDHEMAAPPLLEPLLSENRQLIAIFITSLNTLRS